MAKFIDRVGQVYGAWTVLQRAPDAPHSPATWGGVTQWTCQCSCGVTRDVLARSLSSGASKGCGCTKALKFKQMATTHGDSQNSPTYSSWEGMRSRCLNPNNPRYPRYGARGITIAARWDEYENFLKDMGERPAGMSLDRRDNDRGYGPDNCRWADTYTQMNNTSRNVMIEWEGRNLSITQWARTLGLGSSAFTKRFKKHGIAAETFRPKEHTHDTSSGSPKKKQNKTTHERTNATL